MTDRVQRELILTASPAEVWERLTDPDWLAEWLADEVRLDLRPGGEARFRVGNTVRQGWVEEVSPPRSQAADGSGRGQLAFWWSEGDEPASRVQLTLSPLAGERTRLRVTEARPLELLELLGVPLPGFGGGTRFGPALVAA